MRAEDVVALYTLLRDHGVQLWLDGGWGIDALLQEQTRPHKDLDAFVRFDDLGAMVDLLAAQGFAVKQVWEENRWVAHPQRIQLVSHACPAGSEVATAFVLRSADGHELDIHVLRFDPHGVGIPLWNSDLAFPADAFAGRGVIAGMPVYCLAASTHMATHTGYTLQEKDFQDLRRLHERFGVAYLEEHAHRFPGL